MTAPATNPQPSRCCQHCGYDVRSHAAAVNEWKDVRCPECGQYPPVEHARAPGWQWHAGMALAFAAPLVLTAFEAAGQMVARAGGGAAKAAPGWLALVDIGGLLAIVWGIADQASRAEDRPSFVARGVGFALIYVFVMLLLASSIDWRPYRV